jgi:hypothetical protein
MKIVSYFLLLVIAFAVIKPHSALCNNCCDMWITSDGKGGSCFANGDSLDFPVPECLRDEYQNLLNNPDDPDYNFSRNKKSTSDEGATGAADQNTLVVAGCSATNVTKDKNRRYAWTKEDDRTLLILIFNGDVAALRTVHCGMHSAGSIYHRICFLRSILSTYCGDIEKSLSRIYDGGKAHRWTREMDNQLIYLYRTYGNKWGVIAEFFPEHAVDSVRLRARYLLANRFKL